MSGGNDEPERDGAEPNEPWASQARLELYKLAVEMADRVSARRISGGALPVQSILVGLLAVKGIDRVILASASVLSAFAWFVLVNTYRDLNIAKFAVILDLEQRLPAQIFSEEWKRLRVQSRGRPRWRRLPNYSFVERVTPVLFGLFFGVVLIDAIA